MFISKIKLATAAVLTTGMLGAGVGWVAVPGNGPGLVGPADAAQIPVIDQIKRERDQAVKQRMLAEEARAQAEQARLAEKQARDVAEKARAELQAAQAKLVAAMAQIKQLDDRKDAAKSADRGRDDTLTLERQLSDLLAQHMDRDNKRADEMVALRARLAQEEERFKSMDREQSVELEWTLKAMTEGRSGLENQKRHLAQLLESRGADHPDAVRQKAALNDAAATIERLQAELKERQAKVLKERMQARELMVRLEEEARKIERRAAAEEHDIAAKRAALQDRLRQVAGSGAPASPDQRLTDIERKLDALARELTELRREMKK